MAHYKTLPALLEHVSKNYQNPTAMAYRQNGRWQSISTSQMVETVRMLSQGLVELGLQPGDKVGIVSNPSPFWMMMDLAVLSGGGVTVPMFANISADNLEYEIQESEMRFLFTGSEDQFQAMNPFFSPLQKIITYGCNLSQDKCVTYEKVLELGKKRAGNEPSGYQQRRDAVQENDTATIIYTSGSMGRPKGVELSHRNLISQVEGAGIRFPLDPLFDKILSCLPLAHVFERMVMYYYLSTGTSVYFAEDVKMVGEHLRDIHPTVITMVPRLLEKVFAKMQSNVDVATGLKKKLAAAALQRARELPHDRKKDIRDAVFDKLVYSKMRTAMGGKLRLVISGSAPLDPGLANFFLNIGVNVYEGYGLTESSPVVAANFPGNRKLGTVGPVFPGVEVKIADDGEILVRGPQVMKGYYKQPEETAKTIDSKGWLHTGDLGHLDPENCLKITGRKKELFKTAGGKYVAPVPIEQAIAGNKLVDMVMVIAEGKPYTTCLIFPDLENLKSVKQETGRPQMSDAEFLASPEARAYVQKTLDAVNSKLNHWEQVQKFVIAPKPATIEANELTPTMKIRRHVVMENYQKEIDALYAGGKE